MYPYIIIFNKTITTYALCVLIGILFVGFLCLKNTKKYNVDDNEMLIFLLISLLGAFICSHILYGIVNFKLIITFISNINKIDTLSLLLKCLQEIFGGSVFYGGLIGGIITGLFYAKIKKLDTKLYSYIVTPFIPLFHFFGRIGCFFYGCCYGIETTFGITINGITRLPIQLIEALYNLFLFFLLSYLKKKNMFKNSLLILYLVTYSFYRFIIEFFRGDIYRGILLGLSTSQWISLSILIFGLIYTCLKKKKA